MRPPGHTSSQTWGSPSPPPHVQPRTEHLERRHSTSSSPTAASPRWAPKRIKAIWIQKRFCERTSNPSPRQSLFHRRQRFRAESGTPSNHRKGISNERSPHSHGGYFGGSLVHDHDACPSSKRRARQG